MDAECSLIIEARRKIFPKSGQSEDSRLEEALQELRDRRIARWRGKGNDVPDAR